MDFQKFWAKTKEVIQNGWQWLKPYLSRFHKARKRIWKKYHVNKILLLLSLVAILVTSSYLFYLSSKSM